MSCGAHFLKLLIHLSLGFALYVIESLKNNGLEKVAERITEQKEA